MFYSVLWNVCLDFLSIEDKIKCSYTQHQQKCCLLKLRNDMDSLM